MKPNFRVFILQIKKHILLTKIQFDIDHIYYTEQKGLHWSSQNKCFHSHKQSLPLIHSNILDPLDPSP